LIKGQQDLSNRRANSDLPNYRHELSHEPRYKMTVQWSAKELQRNSVTFKKLQWHSMPQNATHSSGFSTSDLFLAHCAPVISSPVRSWHQRHSQHHV